jgi:hypothetical protein
MTQVQLWAGEGFEFEAEGQISVNGQNLTPSMVEHVIAFGLRQMIRDAGAGAKDDTTRNALAHKKLDALLGGTLRAGTGGGGKRLDPIERRAKEIAMRKVEAVAVPKGWTRAKMADYAEALFKRDRELLLDDAKAEIEAERGAVEEDILADLGL